MKNFSLPVRRATLGLLAGLSVQAAVHGQSFDAPEPAGWYFRLGAAARFNATATITGSLPPGGAGVYDDGFVQPDQGGTASGRTWNWGYNNSGQVQADQLVLTRLDGLATFGRQDLNVPSPNLNGELVAG